MEYRYFYLRLYLLQEINSCLNLSLLLGPWALRMPIGFDVWFKLPKWRFEWTSNGLWCRTSCCSGLGRIFQVRSAMPEQRQKTIVCFCKRSCSGCAPARRGAICHLPLAIGCARGWANDKDRRVGGCAQQFGSVSAAAGASAWYENYRAVDQRRFIWCTARG